MFHSVSSRSSVVMFPARFRFTTEPTESTETNGAGSRITLTHFLGNGCIAPFRQDWASFSGTKRMYEQVPAWQEVAR